MAIRLQHPLPGSRPTSPFGWRAAIPSIGLPAKLHNGQDWAAPAGTPILAAHAGVVRWSDWDNSGGGWMIQLGTANYSTLYGHMRSRSPLAVGRRVRTGDVIGYVGSTGASTGPHLHFILRLPGGNVDPMPYIRSTVRKPMLTKAQAAQLKELHAALCTPVSRTINGKPRSIPVRQDNADTNTMVRELLDATAKPVRRTSTATATPVSAKSQEIPVRQDNADTNTMVRALIGLLGNVADRLSDIEQKLDA